MIKSRIIIKTIEHFISKKLIAFIVTESFLVAVGAIEEATQVALGFLAAQGVVDAVKAFKGQKGKQEAEEE